MQSQAGVPGVPSQPPLLDVTVLHNEVGRLTEVMERDNNFRGYAAQIKAILKDNPNAVRDLRENVFDKMDPVAVQKSPEVRKSIQQFLQIFPKANSSVTLGNREFHTLLLAATSPTLGYAVGATTGVGLLEERKFDSKLEEDLYDYVEKGQKFTITEKNVWDVLDFADSNESQELIDACREFIDEKDGQDENFFKNLPNKAEKLDFATRRHQGWLQIRLLAIPSFIHDETVLARFEKERPHLARLCELFKSPELEGLSDRGSHVKMLIQSQNDVEYLKRLITNKFCIDEILLSSFNLKVIQETCDLLNASSDIKTLQLSFMGGDSDTSLNIVSNMIRTNKTLISLEPGQILVSDETLQNLASALSENSTLTDLDLAYVTMSDTGAKAFAAAIVENRALETLSFRHSSLSDEGVQTVIGILDHLPNLSNLDLSGNNIGINAATQLAAVLRRHPNIASLDLEYNQIDNECVTQLAGALENNRSLRELYLSANPITLAGIQMLAGALERNNTLQILHLGGLKLGSDGANALALALRHNDSLRSLYLDNTGITEEGVTQLAGALQVNHALEALSLEYNQVGFDTASLLLQALKNNQTLNYLNLNHTGLAEYEIELLQEMVTNPNLRIEWFHIGLEG